MAEVVLHRRALRYLQRLPRPDQEWVGAALAHLAEDVGGYPGVIQMAGEWSEYQRIRIGDLRVIFWYDDQKEIIYVDHIGPRGDVYRL